MILVLRYMVEVSRLVSLLGYRITAERTENRNTKNETSSATEQRQTFIRESSDPLPLLPNQSGKETYLRDDI